MAATTAAVIWSSTRSVLRSASAVVCRPETGSHVLRIDGYSHLCQVLSKGEKVTSSAFDVGGHSWRLDLCPNGHKLSKLERHISVFLRLDSWPSRDRVLATPKFSVLDFLDNPAAVNDVGLIRFKHRGYHWGVPDFIDKEELEKPEYLQDDSFAIQCDVAVTTVTEFSDHIVFISRNTM